MPKIVNTKKQGIGLQPLPIPYFFEIKDAFFGGAYAGDAAAASTIIYPYF